MEMGEQIVVCWERSYITLVYPLDVWPFWILIISPLQNNVTMNINCYARGNIRTACLQVVEVLCHYPRQVFPWNHIPSQMVFPDGNVTDAASASVTDAVSATDWQVRVSCRCLCKPAGESFPVSRATVSESLNLSRRPCSVMETKNFFVGFPPAGLQNVSNYSIVRISHEQIWHGPTLLG
jgi:hypothetical protein